MNTKHTHEDLKELLGLHELGEEEREAFLEDIGNLIVESTCTRLVAELRETEKAAFSEFVAAHQDADTFIVELEKKYPQFTTLFKEEAQAFRDEAQAVLGVLDDA